jgi:hypothetical protein
VLPGKEKAKKTQKTKRETEKELMRSSQDKVWD